MADDHSDPDTVEETDAGEDLDPVEQADETEETEDEASAETETKKASPAAPVARKKVVSKRVTPKGGAAASSTSSTASAKAKKKGKDDDEDVSFSSGRYTPPASSSKAQLPSPWWVPALMFAFLIIGALVIMLNYMGVFGDAENIRLIIGLGLILAGIITATQYR